MKKTRLQFRVCCESASVRSIDENASPGSQDFMNAVAAECKSQKHHPEWSNVYNKTHIRWTTHKPEGLSSKDVHMAEFCDRAGEDHGELVEETKKVEEEKRV